MRPTVKEILECGLVYQEERGWGQGGGRADGKLCMIESLGEGNWHLGGDSRSFMDARKVLAKGAGMHSAVSIPSWNDAPGRTYDEVRAGYLRAIELAS